MQLTAITREVSSSINNCELSFHARQPIDVAKAMAQHEKYRHCLAELGVDIISSPAEPELPDAVFVEDAAVIVDELAIITNMGVPTRRREAISLAGTLSHYRQLKSVVEPATLDGGDVLRIGRSVFVGLSQRTNVAGAAQLAEILRPYNYEVQPIAISGCLHLKSACSYIGETRSLLTDPGSNRSGLAGLNYSTFLRKSQLPRTRSCSTTSSLSRRHFAILAPCWSSEISISAPSTSPNCKKPRQA